MLLELLVTFTFHLPTVDAIDSCQIGVAPNTDLESCFVWQQVRGQKPHILYRTRQAGQQGALKLFTAPDSLEALYWVEVSDKAGNALHVSFPCGPNVVQVANTTTVPPGPPAVAAAPEKWFDVMGRRVNPTTPGVYRSSRGRWKVVLR